MCFLQLNGFGVMKTFEIFKAIYPWNIEIMFRKSYFNDPYKNVYIISSFKYVVDPNSNHNFLCFPETIEERVKRVSNIIEKATFGKVLQKCLYEVKVMDCVRAYLSDFVHMVYHVTNQQEHGVKQLCLYVN